MNLLTEPLLRVETPAGLTRLNLPALLAALGRDEVDSLPGLQRHQEDAFHVFLCYLAGAVLARRGSSDPVQDETYWRDGLRALAGRDDDLAWTLVVEDLNQPAFMQPPLPEADHPRLKFHAATPDELDLLPTAKNHDLKRSRAARPEVDEWVYALVSLQTMSGFFGQGNQGISRMNKGFGNRAIVEVVHERRPGARWQDALARLAPHRERVLRGPWGYDPNGLVLVWTKVWDGKASLTFKELDPLYIEICRRVRLRGGEGEDIANADVVPAGKPRIAAKELKGDVGDAWLPIDTKNEAALTVGTTGIHPELLRRLVFNEGFKSTTLHEAIADRPGSVWLSVSVLVRGQGTTDGFREKWVRIPSEIRPRLFGRKTEHDRLATLSKNAIEYAGKMQKGVLKLAVFVFLEGAPGEIKFDRDSAQAWWERAARRFESLWSDDYFPWLWGVAQDFDEEATLRDWAMLLRDHAKTVLDEVMDAMPTHTGRRYRVRTQAERRFWGALYNEKNFPFLKEDRHAVGADQ